MRVGGKETHEGEGGEGDGHIMRRGGREEEWHIMRGGGREGRGTS